MTIKRMAQPSKRRRLVRLYEDDAAERDDRGAESEDKNIQPGSLAHSDAQLPENADEDDDDDDFRDVPDDTLAAVLLLKAQFPKLQGREVAPLVLRSQIYSVVKDRTIVDRQLDEMRLQNKLRVFKLLSLKDEYAYLLAADYCSVIDRLLDEQQGKGTNAGTLQVLKWYAERVLPRCTDINISHADLIWHLGTDARGRPTHDRVTDAHISLLLNLGLLSRHSHTADQYLFAIPSAGPVVKSIIAGRKELLGMLGRRRYPEMFARELDKRRLLQSCLGMRWHVRDLVGSGTLARSETTSGSLLRIVKKF